MRSVYNARYVRMYGWCDDGGAYLNNVVQAAYSAGMGVYFTIWFGLVVAFILFASTLTSFQLRWG